jgi:predicted nucleic acid-binding protein
MKTKSVNSPKPKTVILDSSVWIALMVTHDSNHNVAKKILENIEDLKMKVLLPDIIFFEVVTVLLKLNARNLVKEFVDLNIPLFKLSKEQFLCKSLQISNLIQTKTHDFLIIIYCLEYNVDCFKTFDKRQESNYFLIKGNESN